MIGMESYKKEAEVSPPQVLIIDDDTDSILPIDAIFRMLGCETAYAIETEDAQQKIASGRFDIVVLDWYLDTKTGREIIEGALKRMSEDAQNHYFASPYRARVITYSALRHCEVSLPENNVFEHHGHWRKPINLASLRRTADHMVRDIKLMKRLYSA